MPPEWRRLPEGRANVIGKWAVLQPGSTDKISTVVSVEIEPARGRTAEIFAQDLIKRTKGTLETTDADLAGQRACRVVATITAPNSTDKTPKPLEALIARHEDFIYCAAAIANEAGADHSQAVNELRQGIEFTNVASPSTYMELRQQSVTAFKRFRMRMLATLRPSPDQRRRDAISLRAFNFRRDKPDMVLTLQVLTLRPGATIEQAGEELARGMTQGTDQTVEWVRLSDSPLRLLSKPFTAKGQNREMHVRVGLVKLNEREVGLFNFGLSMPDTSDRMLYEDKCEEMVRTVEPLAAAK